LTLTYTKYTLKFAFPAGTSRGVLSEHIIYILRLSNPAEPQIIGLGEAAPLAGLSPDYLPDFENQLQQYCAKVSLMAHTHPQELLAQVPAHLPSVRFAMETALADLQFGAKRKIFDTDFFLGKQSIPINGLIWMGDKPTMASRIQQKLAEGYKILKLKIGGISFAEECELLEEIRQNFSEKDLEIRLDANGAFNPANALEKLDALAKYGIHSIEQPIMAGNAVQMAHIAKKSPIPIALDEELIGVGNTNKLVLLEKIKPAYLILKPTLLGGFEEVAQWINLAEQQGISWWITSALESSIGLNAIAQFVSTYPVVRPHGLGTGQIYTNNFESPLTIKNAALYCEQNLKWNLALVH
jgi:o-succinylbenzoate synthase